MPERYFLFIGGTVYEGPGSRLKAGGIPYHLKRLESNSDNWIKICELLESEDLVGAVVKFTSHTVGLLSREEYVAATERLFTALGKVPHLVLAHEAVLTGSKGEPYPAVADEDFDEDWDYYRASVFGTTSEEERRLLSLYAERAGVEILPYRTNAEVSLLATSFVEDNESDLLFRLYVPTGRLYAEEADRLISLFRDWLTRVKGSRVRQDGYSTGSGRVYEFFAEGETVLDLSVQFDTFSSFLEMCATDAGSAADTLESLGLESGAAHEVVSRYAKESRRLQLDLRHARESRLLSIKQQLEAEVVDSGDVRVDRLIETLLPAPRTVAQALTPGGLGGNAVAQNITINQQIVGQAETLVMQSIAGQTSLSAQATDLLRLISEHGSAHADALTTAVYELEDDEARTPDRLRAKQRLKAFLLRAGSRVEDATLAALQAYLESRLGV